MANIIYVKYETSTVELSTEQTLFKKITHLKFYASTICYHKVTDFPQQRFIIITINKVKNHSVNPKL